MHDAEVGPCECERERTFERAIGLAARERERDESCGDVNRMARR